jgi:tetratricopeptide (TPR) repeat protein
MSPAGGEEQVYNVPWKVWAPAETPKQGLALYWFPASAEEAQRSSLRNSRVLSLFASQCVSLLVADAATPLGQKFAAAGVPVAVLATADGALVGKAEGEKGMLKVAAVEKLVGDEMKRRDDSLKQKFEEGKLKSKTDPPAAIAAFQTVFGERCLFPKRAKDAAKELKKLGQSVSEEVSDTRDPVLEPVRSAEIEKVMLKGLASENAGRYEEARKLYIQARSMDPADPAPVRYYAELLRHHTGEWQKARAEFERLLTMRVDPLSRAVALHGLGKMTIHEGAFEKGRQMMERSVAAYPLALAYRNLAVYWNSEGDLVKTGQFVDEALRLDPHDPFNIVFAAVFKATTGHVAEALRIAQENEAMLPASYNLAAINAIAGNREKALSLLRRHFDSYERYDAVRGEEMMEARVDRVFDSLRADKEFLALTAKADGRMKMPAGHTSH